MVETISRPQLTDAVIREVGLSRNQSAELVESVLAEMSEALVRGETVKLPSFGSFSVRQKGRRMGRNPKTGDEVPILPRRVLVFRPSRVLKKSINDSLVGGAGKGAEETTQPEKTTGSAVRDDRYTAPARPLVTELSLNVQSVNVICEATPAP